MAELKTKKTKESVSKFIARIKDEGKREDAKTLVRVFKDATGMKPYMLGTSIVGYGSYHYESERSSQKGDWPLTGFSPRVQNFTLYIMPGSRNYGVLLKKLGKYKVSNGSCVYIKRVSDVHIPTLKALIKKSVSDMKKTYNV